MTALHFQVPSPGYTMSIAFSASAARRIAGWLLALLLATGTYATGESRMAIVPRELYLISALDDGGRLITEVLPDAARAGV